MKNAKAPLIAAIIGAVLAVVVVVGLVTWATQDPDENPADAKASPTASASPSETAEAPESPAADPKLEAFTAAAAEAVPVFGSLPPEQIAGYGQQICAGLEKAGGDVAAVVPGVVEQGGGVITKPQATGLVKAAKSTYC